MSIFHFPSRRHSDNPVRWFTKLQAADALTKDLGDSGARPVIDRHPAVAYLGGHDATLNYLHQRWVTLFGAMLDEDLEADPGPIQEVAWQTWRRLVDERYGLARVLSWYRHDATVREADLRHRRLLGQAAGCKPAVLPSFASAALHLESPPLAASG